MSAGELDCITTPAQRVRLPAGATIACDNGVYGKGWPGDHAWWRWLMNQLDERVRFAVAPDVVADAAATLERSAPWLPRIRALGMPAAYVLQNGQESFEPPWDDLDAVFVGGDTDWKLGPEARALVTEARARGKWVHMGRVNSWRRIDYASAIGCDSVDGTFLTFGPDIRLPELLGWLRRIDTNPALF